MHASSEDNAWILGSVNDWSKRFVSVVETLSHVVHFEIHFGTWMIINDNPYETPRICLSRLEFHELRSLIPLIDATIRRRRRRQAVVVTPSSLFIHGPSIHGFFPLSKKHYVLVRDVKPGQIRVLLCHQTKIYLGRPEHKELTLDQYHVFKSLTPIIQTYMACQTQHIVRT